MEFKVLYWTDFLIRIKDGVCIYVLYFNAQIKFDPSYYTNFRITNYDNKIM